MNVKEIFGKAEDGTLTLEQFEELAKECKFVDLNEGNYISKKKFEDELKSRDEQINILNETIGARDTDLEGLKKQLTEAGTDADKLNSLSSDFDNLQKKYNDDVKSYKEQLKKQAYEFAVKDFANSKQFTSNAAKRDFIQSMISKELKMDGDKILGADDFVNSYSIDNSDAFYTEPKPQDVEAQSSKPQFVNSTVGTEVVGDNDGGFNFNFVGVRPHD